jgi:murein DD-endopeptidase MepM/ murein hydrolase activator NlpD
VINNKSLILAESGRQGDRRRRAKVVAGMAIACVLGAVAAIAAVEDAGRASGRTDAQTVISALPLAADVLDAWGGDRYVREELVRGGDTLGSLLARLDVHPADQAVLGRDHSQSRAFRALRPGMSVEAETDANGRLLSLRFLAARDLVLGFDRSPSGFSLVEEPANLERHVVVRSGRIESTLFAAADDADVPDPVATQLAEVFAGEVDFHRDLRRGDRFTVVFERILHEGRPVRSGRLLAASFESGKRTLRAVWFDDGEGRGSYYAPDGRTLRKSFLRSPLEFSRITSGFSMRLHPILNTWRQHNGVDYAAPTGTKVRAVGDGTVDFAGVQSGYGNVVVLRHPSGVTTHYAHLSAIHVRKGERVAQAGTIGLVGATGWATGPHLHFELRVNNEYRNPLAMTPPEAEPLSGQRLAVFRSATSGVTQQLGLARELTLAALE